MKTKEATVFMCLNPKPDIFVQRLWIPSPGQMPVHMSFLKVVSDNKGREVGSFGWGMLRAYSTQLLKGIIQCPNYLMVILGRCARHCKQKT